MKAILTDVGRCVGCDRCVEACARENRLGDDVAYRWRQKDGLSANRFTAVVRTGGLNVRKQCRHCLRPACVSACPVGALTRGEDGAVVYDAGRCLGCRYCMMACPFGIPRYEWASKVPYVRKCTLCQASRLAAGRQPACTEACPEKATIFGERDELLREAHRRIDSNPGAYLTRVIGEREVGGTAILYLAPRDVAFLNPGGRADERPMPERTLLAMTAVPWAFCGVVLVMGGVWWILDRRMRLASRKALGESEEKVQP